MICRQHALKSPQLPHWGKIIDEVTVVLNYLINIFAIMWQIRGGFLLANNNSQSFPKLAIFPIFQIGMGVRGGDKKLCFLSTVS